MKRAIVLGLAGLMAFGAVASGQFGKVRKAGKAIEARKSAGNEIWRPRVQTISGWNGEEWVAAEEYTTQYDAEGRVLVDLIRSLDPELVIEERITYTYNADGMQTSQLTEIARDGGEFTNYSKTERSYDPIVPSLIVENVAYMWNDGWVLMGNNYRRVVTRNEAGNVTSTAVEVLYNGAYEATERMLVEYGDDGKASKITVEVLGLDDAGGYVWNTDVVYTDIVWLRTDGQIVSEDFVGSRNAMLSCTTIDADGENHVTIEYGSPEGSYTSTLKYALGEIEVNHEALDGNGSYKNVQHNTYTQAGGENTYYTYVDIYMVNDYGQETLSYSAEGEGLDPEESAMEIMQWTVGEVEYDETYGYPLLYTVKNYEGEDTGMVNMMQVKFEDYSEVSGVEALESEEGPAEYYNLQGMRIAKPEAGKIYIERRNGISRLLR